MPDDKPPSLDPAASKTFCVLPWIHSYFATDGQAGLCCISPAPLPAPDHGHYNIQYHAMRDIFHSPAMDDVRGQLLEGKQIERCSACYSTERVDAGLRTHFNELWQKKMPGLMEIIKERQEKPAFDKPLSVDIRFGNLCNLQCQICNPHNSTQIERDPVLLKWNDATYLHLAESRFKGDVAWYESPMFEDELAEATTGLRYITLGGGEPSISKPAIKWLERLIQSGRAAQIEIHISTNISNVNPRFFDLAAQFGKTQLYLSIDGFGPLNEYLRYPSKWRIVERNVNYVSELARQGNFEINITPVISAYNALSIAHLFEWADVRGFGIYAFPGRGVDQIDCALIPEDARQLIVQRIRDFVKSAKNPNPSYDTIEEFCRHLELPVDPAYAASCRDKFHAFTHEIDDHRGMRFENHGPEMARFLGYSSGSNSFGSTGVIPDHRGAEADIKVGHREAASIARGTPKPTS